MNRIFKKQLLLLLFLFLAVLDAAASSSSLEINEIMYAPSPEQGGSANEWVELYNHQNNSLNLSSCLFYGKELGKGMVEGHGFIIMARDVLKFKEIYGDNFLVFVNSFKGGLNNEGEEMVLNCTGSGGSETKFAYNPASRTESNGSSTLCLFNSAWQECLPTPGRENSLNQKQPGQVYDSTLDSKNIILSVFLDENIYLNHRYDDLFRIKIENKENCSSKDTVTVFYNITKPASVEKVLVQEGEFTKEIGCSSYASTGEFNPLEVGDYLLCGRISNSTFAEINLSDNQACREFTVVDTQTIPCDVNLQINKEESLISEDGQSVKFNLTLNNESFPIVIEYWIEDLFGNIVKSKMNTTNTNQKSWKANIDEKDKVLFIKSQVYPACKDEDRTDNFAEKMLIVMKNEILPLSLTSTNSSKSKIEIKKNTPSAASFGEVVQVDLEIYKGATNKYSVAAWVEKDTKPISEKTKINLKTDNLDYGLTLPLQIDPNCDRKIKDGPALLIVEGLGERAEQPLTLSGINKNLCKESVKVVEEQADERHSNKLAYEIINLPASAVAGEILPVKVELQNDNKDHNFKAWSYLYRGSKCYSCSSGEEEKDSNLISFDLDTGKIKIIEFPIKIDEGIAVGEYSLMVKLNKDDQKTDKSLTKKVYISNNEQIKTSSNSAPAKSTESVKESSAENLAQENYLQLAIKKKELLPELPGIVIYEDNSEKAKQLIPSVLVIAFGLLSLVLAWKKG